MFEVKGKARVALLAALFVLLAVAGVAAATSGSVATYTYTVPGTTIAIPDRVYTQTVDIPTVTQTITQTTTQTVTVTVTTTPTTTTTPTPTPTSIGGTAGTGLYMLGGSLANVSDSHLASYRIGVGDTSVPGAIAKVGGLGLVYFAGTDVNTGWSTGVPYSQALANGWLLKDSSGNLLVNKGFPSDYIGDIGSVGYQQAFITNVLGFLQAHPGIDGVFLDDVLYDPKALTGTYPAKYPDTASWANAQLSFIQAVHSALHAQGYYLAANAGAYIPGDSNSNDGTNTITWWKMLGPYIDGLMNEYYGETSNGVNQLRSTGTSWYQEWDGWQRLIGVAQSFGDDFIGIEYQGTLNTAAATYGKASFLLEWDGKTNSVFDFSYGQSDPTDPSWTTDIGTPVAAKVAVGVGYERAYTKGTVLVNPSPTTSQTFTVGGVSYTLAPTTAKIIAS